MTTCPNDLSKRTTYQRNCQKRPPSSWRHAPRRHVEDAAVVHGGKACHHRQRRHVYGRFLPLGVSLHYGPCRHVSRRQGCVARCLYRLVCLLAVCLLAFQFGLHEALTGSHYYHARPYIVISHLQRSDANSSRNRKMRPARRRKVIGSSAAT
jgi:hypothetical protein